MVAPPFKAGQLWLGVATLIALVAASLAFGFHFVGRFCLFAIPVLIGFSALRGGKFPFIFGKHQLARSRDARGYCVAIVVCALIAAAELSVLIGDLRQTD